MDIREFRNPTPGPLTRDEAAELTRWLEEAQRQQRTQAAGNVVMTDTGTGYHLSILR